MTSGTRDFYVIIEQDEDGTYIAEVPQLCACYTQGDSLDEVMDNIKEVIQLCLEEGGDDNLPNLVDIRRISV